MVNRSGEGFELFGLLGVRARGKEKEWICEQDDDSSAA